MVPILAFYGHARLQGTMLDFANKVSPVFALLYAILVYAISISLPSPRTASVTYEMAIQPYFGISSLWSSLIYFSVVLMFVLNRSQIVNFIGKFLTPLIILILLCIICIGFFVEMEPIKASIFENSFSAGILEGYQTFDAIGGVVVGGVIVISLTLQGNYTYQEKKSIIAKSGLVAGIGLFLIYSGLIALGAFTSGTLVIENRTELLNLLSVETLENFGAAFLAVLVALACFTTAVGIVTGTSDFVKGLAGNSQIAYQITAVLGCLIGVAIGQFNVPYIINIAVPALMFIYPITIVLILLNALPKKYASNIVFRGVTITTLLFSIPDFLPVVFSEELATSIIEFIPLSKYSLGWVLPGLLVFIVLNSLKMTPPGSFLEKN
jgi:LIVCS family branched-chain amino acid:cation transporter